MKKSFKGKYTRIKIRVDSWIMSKPRGRVFFRREKREQRDKYPRIADEKRLTASPRREEKGSIASVQVVLIKVSGRTGLSFLKNALYIHTVYTHTYTVKRKNLLYTLFLTTNPPRFARKS